MADFGSAMGIPHQQINACMRLYHNIMEGFDEFDIEWGVKQVLSTHKYPTMPTPAELFECCQDAAFEKLKGKVDEKHE